MHVVHASYILSSAQHYVHIYNTQVSCDPMVYLAHREPGRHDKEIDVNLNKIILIQTGHEHNTTTEKYTIKQEKHIQCLYL